MSTPGSTNGEALAEQAGLRYVREGEPGYDRRRRGGGFVYLAPGGRAVEGPETERIGALAVPPAWRDVWVCADPHGHIQATGVDGAGRKQYIYHPTWEELRDEVKFARLVEFGSGVGALRRRVDADLRLPGLPRQRVTALAVAVLDRTLIRVGNRRYAQENESYGLTTLTADHVEVAGTHVRLEFEGKGGSEHELVFRDRRLAALIARCRELSGETLFSYQAERGAASISSADVNQYLAAVMRGPFTAKDFRTWGASSLVTEWLATEPERSERAVLAAIDSAAERLGNTRAVCRGSYLHPAVPEAFLSGALAEAWCRSRAGRWTDRAESALSRLLRSG
jgi:DNA topoisomerase I